MKKIPAGSSFLFFILVLLSSSLKAQKVFSEKGVAIRGYDPVAYHLEKKPVAGYDCLSYEWRQATWKFSTVEYRSLFQQAPEKFAPAYGGYCAFGVSENHLSPTDPKAFTIVHDTLFLNYSLKVKELWLRDTIQRIKIANTLWPNLQ